MDRQMNSNGIRPLFLETINKTLPPVRRTVVHNPENSIGCFIRFLRHHLIHQPVKWFNAALGFTKAKNFCSVNIPGRKVNQCPATGILMFYSHWFSRTWRSCGMFANSGLDTGLFISRDDIIIRSQRETFPLPGIKIKYSSGFFDELGISGINPGSVEPRTNSVLMQPSPHTGIAH